MVSELRELRRQLALSQAEFADRLGVPAETLRTWDSGRRPAPAPVMRRARDAACRCVDETELVRLKQLATEFSVHPATLQAAAKTGKLVVHFSEKSAFGRPILYGTRGEVKRFKAVHYRRSGGQRTLQKPLTAVPPDYDERLKCVRQRLTVISGRFRATHWRRWQSCGVPMGSSQATSFAGVLGPNREGGAD